MDSPKALFKTVGVPGQVVVDHQVGALEVDSFTGSVGCQQHLNGWVVFERFLYLETMFPACASVDNDHSILASKKSGDAFFQIVECIAMLGENNQLLVRRRLGRRNWTGTIGHFRFNQLLPRCGGEYFTKQA